MSKILALRVNVNMSEDGMQILMTLQSPYGLFRSQLSFFFLGSCMTINYQPLRMVLSKERLSKLCETTSLKFVKCNAMNEVLF